MRCICQVQSRFIGISEKLATRSIEFDLLDITTDLSTYRLDDDLLQKTLRNKVEKLAAKETFDSSATLSRVLAKEGIIDGQGEAAELHAGALQLVERNPACEIPG